MIVSTDSAAHLLHSSLFQLASADEWVATKVIYDNNTVISDQDIRDFARYTNHVKVPLVQIYFRLGYNLLMKDRRFDTVQGTGYRFVVEN